MGPNASSEGEAMGGPSMIFEPPVDVVGVHFLHPLIYRLKWDVVVDRAVFNKDLALGVVGVRRDVQVLLVLLWCHSAHFGCEQVDERVALQQAVEGYNALNVVASANLLKTGLAAEAVSNASSELLVGSRVLSGLSEAGIYQSAQLFRVEQESVRRFEGTEEVPLTQLVHPCIPINTRVDVLGEGGNRTIRVSVLVAIFW
mmetsp:Transcript_28700/g.43427  ORF Transcript_28700/g.43427 Transcript_28700/m.43427 type:complete len:200 (+) Transcript_28700:739-1338(+)